jgi:hypothetical protein
MESTNSHLNVLAQVAPGEVTVGPAPVQPQAGSSMSFRKRLKSRKQHDTQSAVLRASSADNIKSVSERADIQTGTVQVEQIQPHSVAAFTVSESFYTSSRRMYNKIEPKVLSLPCSCFECSYACSIAGCIGCCNKDQEQL